MRRSSKLPVYRHYRALFEEGSYCGMSDGDLLSRFVSHDDDDSAELAFAVLVERHASAVMRICKAILGNESDAEDAFQATFLVLATKAGRLKVGETLGPWLSSVARRVSRRARVRTLARAARELHAAQLAGSRVTTDGSGADDSLILHEEIDRLPERFRLPLMLCDLECRSHQEAAQTLGWPLGTVKSRQARARERLRVRLSRRGFSGMFPLAGAARAARYPVPDSLIQTTTRAAVGLVTRTPVAGAVSASVSNLVNNTLRTMIMTKLSSILLGVFLTVSVLVAATVVGQTPKDPTRPSNTANASNDPGPAPGPTAASVFEYEIRIWKNGTAITPTMKLRAHPGEPSQLQIPEGMIELSFQTGDSSIQRASVYLRNSLAPAGTQTATRTTPATKANPNSNAPLPSALPDLTAADNLRKALKAIDRAAADDSAAKLLKDVAEASEKVAPTTAELTLKALGLSRVAPENKDYEKRLADIEKKLERILAVIDRVPATRPAGKHGPEMK